MAEQKSVKELVLETLAPIADIMSPYKEEDLIDTNEIYRMILEKAPEIIDIFKMLDGEQVDLRSFVWGLNLGCCFGVRIESTRMLYVLDDFTDTLAEGVNDIFEDENDEDKED